MKSLKPLSLAASTAALIACTLAFPALSFAQDADTSSLTRADVQADLVRLEQAGYQPTIVPPDYPADIQAAEAKVATQTPAPHAQATVQSAPQAQATVPSIQQAALNSRVFGPRDTFYDGA